MLFGYGQEAGRLRQAETIRADLAGIVWVDMVEPSAADEAFVETALGIDVPTRDEMQEIEISSRLYQEDGAAFMTALLPTNTDTDEPDVAPVTFVLAGEHLVTVRYHRPRSFTAFPARAERIGAPCDTNELVLMAILEAAVDRIADVLERAGRDVDAVSREVFGDRTAEPMSSQELRTLLRRLGRSGDLVSKLRDGLVSLERLVGFLVPVLDHRGSADKELRGRLKTLARDVDSLTDHADFLAQKITFLLDATLGLVNIEQNSIMKIVSIAALVFLPPTLVGAIYGMNFEVMPELHWTLGYPLALVLMALSAILPYWFFKRRGWL